MKIPSVRPFLHGTPSEVCRYYNLPTAHQAEANRERDVYKDRLSWTSLMIEVLARAVTESANPDATQEELEAHILEVAVMAYAWRDDLRGELPAALASMLDDTEQREAPPA